MGNVFTSVGHYNGPKQRPVTWARGRIRAAFASGTWISTKEIYDATKRKVKREVVHEILKEMLSAREIKMRLITNTGGRERTEFIAMLHNEAVEKVFS